LRGAARLGAGYDCSDAYSLFTCRSSHCSTPWPSPARPRACGSARTWRGCHPSPAPAPWEGSA
jgi:hypothetical protein